MNPFKIKTLDSFTIDDCESYIKCYPYGEHYMEVKNRMRELKRGSKKNNDISKKEESHHNKNNNNQSVVTVSLAKNESKKRYTNSSPKNDRRYRKTRQLNVSTSTQDESVIDKILWWIGAIVIVLIVGTIVISVLNAILPEGASEFIKKYRFAIYIICLMISKWFDNN